MSTSKLQRFVSNLINTHLGGYTIRENLRPEWLISTQGERLELDFYIEELHVAIEVQGAQHYIPVPHFQGKNGFKEQVRRDAYKRYICEFRDIKLVEVTNEREATDAVLSIASSIVPKKHTLLDHSAKDPRLWAELTQARMSVEVADKDIHKLRKNIRRLESRKDTWSESERKDYEFLVGKMKGLVRKRNRTVASLGGKKTYLPQRKA